MDRNVATVYTVGSLSELLSVYNWRQRSSVIVIVVLVVVAAAAAADLKPEKLRAVVKAQYFSPLFQTKKPPNSVN